MSVSSLLKLPSGIQVSLTRILGAGVVIPRRQWFKETMVAGGAVGSNNGDTAGKAAASSWHICFWADRTADRPATLVTINGVNVSQLSDSGCSHISAAYNFMRHRTACYPHITVRPCNGEMLISPHAACRLPIKQLRATPQPLQFQGQGSNLYSPDRRKYHHFGNPNAIGQYFPMLECELSLVDFPWHAGCAPIFIPICLSDEAFSIFCELEMNYVKLMSGKLLYTVVEWSPGRVGNECASTPCETAAQCNHLSLDRTN
ncbi:hypothetical protein J6590_025150 [Homalodisca vitripennis]|nr:hypothetical protein J6590_025150 [Homalodisca vitripennis]